MCLKFCCLLFIVSILIFVYVNSVSGIQIGYLNRILLYLMTLTVKSKVNSHPFASLIILNSTPFLLSTPTTPPPYSTLEININERM